MEPKFEVKIDGKIYVLPFVGYKKTHEFPKTVPPRDRNYLFLSKDHDFDNNQPSEALRALIGGKEMMSPEFIFEQSTGVEYFVLEPMRDWKEMLLKNGMVVVKEQRPVLVYGKLKPEDFFSSAECAKYSLPEMAYKGNPMVVYDLIERKHVLMGDKEYVSLYDPHMILLNGVGEISFLKNGRYRFLVKTDEPSVCYMENERMHLKNIKTYIDVTSLEKLSVVDAPEIDAFFCSTFEDLPGLMNWINLGVFEGRDFFAYDKIAQISTNSELNGLLSHFVKTNNKTFDDEVCKLLPSHIKDFLLTQIQSYF